MVAGMDVHRAGPPAHIGPIAHLTGEQARDAVFVQMGDRVGRMDDHGDAVESEHELRTWPIQRAQTSQCDHLIALYRA